MATQEFTLPLSFYPIPQTYGFQDLTGQQFGRLTVLGYAGKLGPHKNGRYTTLFFCQCDCGRITRTASSSLKRGISESCGRHKKPRSHGDSVGQKETPELRAYRSAQDRCSNPKVRNFHRYGGRGIEFRFTSYDEFLAHVGRKPSPKHSLDRINVHGHYEIGNVRWATATQQARNTEKNVFIEVDGQSVLLIEWVESQGLDMKTVERRRKKGWCLDCMGNPAHELCSHRNLNRLI